MAPSLDVIVLQHNHSDLTVPLIESIHSTYENARVILVDNGSDQQESFNAINAMHDEDLLIANDENDGYIRGCNQGLRVSEADYICLQNNDTLMYEGGYSRLIWHLSENRDLGAIGPLCNANESFQSIRNHETWLESISEPHRASIVAERLHRQRTATAIGVLAFFCIVFPREIVREVGMLDTDFGAGYGADDDYCIRIKDLGKRIAIALDVYVWHEQRVTQKDVLGSLEEIDREGIRALELLDRKHAK